MKKICLPMLNPAHDPSEEEATALIKGIFMQGGTIVDYHESMNETLAQFVVVPSQSNL